jgi:NADH:ubiquinone oxidoreductase subunit E
MLIQICVGSSCHIKGAPEIVELLTKAVEENNLQDEVTLAGSFCIGECNRFGVTVQIDDEVHTGINRENFRQFFEDKILSVIKNERM